MVIWLAGLSGSGKSTFATYITNELKKKYKGKVLKIDGDEIRYLFKNDLGHSLKDRVKNAERISKLVYFLQKNTNLIIVVSVLSISQKWLDWNRKKIKDYFQIYMNVSFRILSKRNSKGVYSNKINVVGADIKYKKPRKNDMVIKNNFRTKEIKRFSKKIFSNKKILNFLIKYKKKQ